MIKSYTDMQIEIIDKHSRPNVITGLACDITMKRKLAKDNLPGISFYRFILKAEHTSVLEHPHIIFLITGVSRSFMSQITRTRIAGYTISSQHYQLYEDYDDILMPDPPFLLKEGIKMCNQQYGALIELGVPREEARQTLPGSKAVNILWTVNGHTLFHFLRSRLCFRNVLEMRLFAEKIMMIALDWWPELFSLVGPPCIMDGKCNQGHMRCDGKGVKQVWGKPREGGLLGY